MRRSGLRDADCDHVCEGGAYASMHHFWWRGGHFFPVIFSGCAWAMVSPGQGVDAVFCAAACIASLMGAVMRQPVMVVLLLFMCFPPSGGVCLPWLHHWLGDAPPACVAVISRVSSCGHCAFENAFARARDVSRKIAS